EIASSLGITESAVRLLIAGAKGKLLAARLERPTPYVDTTLYVAWNAMFVSAYLEAYRALGGALGESCRGFALKTLDRILAEARRGLASGGGLCPWRQSRPGGMARRRARRPGIYGHGPARRLRGHA